MFQRRQLHPTLVLLPGKSYGLRSLVGCSPWGRWELDTTERLHFHFSLPCLGEGNGNPLQCSCLENPRDGGACWAATYGVTQSWTQLKLFISSSSKPWEYRKKILRFQKQSGQRSSIKSFHLCSSGSEASSQEIGLIAQGLRIKL